MHLSLEQAPVGNLVRPDELVAPAENENRSTVHEVAKKIRALRLVQL